MGADQFPHPETPKVGRSPFSLRESEGRMLPHPPPGIPTGFCQEARGCAAEALPRVKAKDINNPNGGRGLGGEDEARMHADERKWGRIILRWRR